jgi:hypothetical protein
MNDDTPSWQAFDAVGGHGAGADTDTPPGPVSWSRVTAPAPSRGEIIPIVVSPGLASSPWVRPAARRLAAGVATDGGLPILIDASLEHPFLEDPEDGEGLTDAFRFGASLTRITRTGADRVPFVPVGTPVADPREILGDPGWEVIRERLRAERRGAFVLLPLDQIGARAFLAEFGSAVLFCDREEAKLGAIRAARSWAAIVGPDTVSERAPGEGYAVEIASLAPTEPRRSTSAAPGTTRWESVRAGSDTRTAEVDPGPVVAAAPAPETREAVERPEADPSSPLAGAEHSVGDEDGERPARADEVAPEPPRGTRKRKSVPADTGTKWLVPAVLLAVAVVVLALYALGIIRIP